MPRHSISKNKQTADVEVPSDRPRIQHHIIWSPAVYAGIGLFLVFFLIFFITHPHEALAFVTVTIEQVFSLVPVLKWAAIAAVVLWFARKGALAYQEWLYAHGQHGRNNVYAEGENFIAHSGRVTVESVHEIVEHNHYERGNEQPLLELPAPTVPTFAATLPLLAQLVDENKTLGLKQKKWFLGYNVDGTPNVGRLYDMRGGAFGGYQGAGKSVTMANYAYQCAANGFKLVVFDASGDDPEDSLLSKLQSVRSSFLCEPVIDDEEDIRTRRAWLAEYFDTRRHSGLDVNTLEPVGVFIDEWNKYMRAIKNPQLRTATINLAIDLAGLGRKSGVFLFLGGQTWQDETIGGAKVRQNLPSRVAHKMERSQMKLLLDCSDAKIDELTTPDLMTGQVIMAGANGGLFRLNMPESQHNDGSECIEMAIHRTEKRLTGYISTAQNIAPAIAQCTAHPTIVLPAQPEASAPATTRRLAIEDTGALKAFRAKSEDRERAKVIPPDSPDSDKRIDIPPHIYQKIKDAGELMKAQYDGKVFRKELTEKLHLDHDKGWKMVKQVADDEGWWHALPPEITDEEWTAMKAKYGNKCLACGKPESEVELTKDHVKPKRQGGERGPSNLQPLCRSCNDKKGKYKTIDYRPKEGA